MQQNPFIYIAGPCVIENERMTLAIADQLKTIASNRNMLFVFKASFDKANRTSLASFRGPGIAEGLRILDKVRRETGLPILTDVHEPSQAAIAAEVADILQIPAFLCRQTDMLAAAARTGKTVNIKKGQFVSPTDMRYAVQKVLDSGNSGIWLTERGVCHGYNDLIVDFRAFSILRALGHPVIFDATHAVQTPSQGGTSSGKREYVLPLARAAVAYGVDGLFTEVHPDPDKALCDGPNSIPLDTVPALLDVIERVRDTICSAEIPTHC